MSPGFASTFAIDVLYIGTMIWRNKKKLLLKWSKRRVRIDEIETVDLIGMMDDPNVVIVDIRDVRERQRTGEIPGSVQVPPGIIAYLFDPDLPYFKESFGQEDKKFVFYRASGRRSALAVATLDDMGFDVAHLKDGFSTWVGKGGPVAVVEDI